MEIGWERWCVVFLLLSWEGKRLLLVPWGCFPANHWGREEFWDVTEASVLLW